VYNDDGISRYASNKNTDENWGPALSKRYEKIAKQISHGIKKVCTIIDETKGHEGLNTDRIYKNIFETIFPDDLFNLKYDKQGENFTLAYNCRRTGRLIYERAVALLAEYYSVMQRPAFYPEYGNPERGE
jgi:hypothetical protein